MADGFVHDHICIVSLALQHNLSDNLQRNKICEMDCCGGDTADAYWIVYLCTSQYLYSLKIPFLYVKIYKRRNEYGCYI